METHSNIDLDCVAPERADRTSPCPQRLSTDDDIDLTVTTKNKDVAQHPIVYREVEETPKFQDSDGQSSDGHRKQRRRSRRSLPMRYRASHSPPGCSSPESDTRPTSHGQLPKVRLSSILARPQLDINDDGDDNEQDFRKRKEELLQSQRGDRQVFDRNKRMFGMLMGTLKRFKTEETSREEVTLKRSRIDEKLEISKINEEDLPRELPLIMRSNEDENDKSRIIDKAELKLDIMGRLKNWENSHKHLVNFIQTETKPKIFWMPKEHIPETEKQLKSTRDYYKLFMAERAAKCKKELDDLEKQPLRSHMETDDYYRRRSSDSPDDHRRHRYHRTSRDYRSPESETSRSSDYSPRRR